MKYYSDYLLESNVKTGHIQRKIKFDFDIEKSKHAIDRLNRKNADGSDAYIPIEFKEVNSLISKATEQIINELVIDKKDVNCDSFVIQSESDGLTVVGKMTKNKSNDLTFVVVTVYRGSEFRLSKEQRKQGGIIKIK